MRGAALCLAAAAVAAAATAGCLSSTEFKCLQDADCGAGGTCEPIGYCSVANAQCAGTGRSFGDSAGHGLSNTCVPTTQAVGCPADYASVAGSSHRYKLLPIMSWDQAKTMCEQASTAAYLAVPDDAAELKNLTTVVSPPLWIGLDDQAAQGMFVTPKNVPATFLPWATGEPRRGDDCARASSSTRIATDLCSAKHVAVCECEP